MKITTTKQTLLNSLSHSQGVVERRNIAPILSNVLIVSNEKGITFTSTDTEIEVNDTVDGYVLESGSMTVPAHTLYEIVRKLPDGQSIEIGTLGSQMKLASGRSNFKLGCLPVEDFPKMPECDLKHKFTLSSNELKELIDRTRFAISTEETRYYLNGIYLHSAKSCKNVEVLRAVATDGHRLARVEMPAPEGSKGIPGVIIPRKTVNEVRKLLDETTGDIEIAMSEAKVRFTFESVVITSKLIDGTFPDYERVIPSGNDKMLDANARVFAEAIDRVATISSEKSRAVKLSLSNGKMVLSARSSETGSSTEEIDVKYDSENMEIGFNAKYILDTIKQIDDEISIELGNSKQPVILRDKKKSNAVYVVMPMVV